MSALLRSKCCKASCQSASMARLSHRALRCYSGKPLGRDFYLTLSRSQLGYGSASVRYSFKRTSMRSARLFSVVADASEKEEEDSKDDDSKKDEDSKDSDDSKKTEDSLEFDSESDSSSNSESEFEADSSSESESKTESESGSGSENASESESDSDLSSDSDSESDENTNSSDSDDEFTKTLADSKKADASIRQSEIQESAKSEITAGIDWTQFEKEKLRFTGLNYHCTRADLWELCEDAIGAVDDGSRNESDGSVITVILPRNQERTDMNRGFSFVQFVSHAAATRVYERLNGQVFQGRTLNIEFAKQRTDDRRTGQFGGGFRERQQRPGFSQGGDRENASRIGKNMEEVLKLLEDDSDASDGETEKAQVVTSNTTAQQQQTAQPLDLSSIVADAGSVPLEFEQSTQRQTAAQSTAAAMQTVAAANLNTAAGNQQNKLTLVAVTSGIPLKALSQMDIDSMFCGLGTVSDTLSTANGVSVFQVDLFQRWLTTANTVDTQQTVAATTKTTTTATAIPTRSQPTQQPQEYVQTPVSTAASGSSVAQSDGFNLIGDEEMDKLVDDAVADVKNMGVEDKSIDEKLKDLPPPGSPDFDPLKTWIAIRGDPRKYNKGIKDTSGSSEPKAKSTAANGGSAITKEEGFGLTVNSVESKDKKSETVDWDDIFKAAPSEEKTATDSGAEKKTQSVQELFDSLFSDSDEEAETEKVKSVMAE